MVFPPRSLASIRPSSLHRDVMSTGSHVALFISSLTGGGAERVVTTLANAFVERGHRVDLLLSSKHGPFVSEVAPRVETHDFASPHTSLTIPALIRVLRHANPDVLVSALSGPTVAAYCAVSWMRMRGMSPPHLCATVHSLPTIDQNRADTFRARLLLQAFRLALQRIETIVGVSETVAQSITQFTGRPREDLHVIPNPIDNSPPVPDPSHPWLKQSSAVVVTAGRLCPEKDYPTLLHALAQLNSSQTVRALILGEGDDLQSLQSLSRDLGIADQTDFLGFVDHPRRVMAQADLFVLPSPFEAFGNVVVEAMACGTPVVAAHDSGGPREILGDADYGYDPFFPSGDASALARSIGQVLNTSVDTDRLRRRAADFSIPNVAEQYVSLFRRRAGTPAPTNAN